MMKRLVHVPAACVLGWSVLAVGGSVTGAVAAHAQQSVAAEAHGDTRAEDVLARPVTLTLDQVTIEAAIRALANATGTRIQYRQQVVAIATRVSLHADRMSLGDALRHVLAGTQLVAVPFAPDLITIKQESAASNRSDVGEIGGVVTDAKSKKPLRGATVTLDDTLGTARTGEDGRYRLVHVPAGTHRVTVRLVGFARQTRVVSVTADQNTAMNFVLETSVNTLDQVVVTATGAQRYRELGHVVATINADSLVKQAPITELSDFLQSRIPGLQVINGNGGYAGSTITLQLRGQSSTALQSSPIVIVDGVRYQADNSASNALGDQDLRGVSSSLQQRSPLNDLNPNDIETIEVVKGPSASTLYGPNAANGAIVITTKRGKAGPSRFSWYARPVNNDVPATGIAGTSYTVWAHNPTTLQPVTFRCTLISQYINHSCVVDSITKGKTVVQIDTLSPIAHNRPTWQFGANLSGGAAAARYYVSGNYSNQVGSMQIPLAIQHLIQRRLGPSALSADQTTPNALTTIGTQATLASDVSSWFGLNGSFGYTNVNNNRSAYSYLYGNAISLPNFGILDSSTVASTISNSLYPASAALSTSIEKDNRLLASLSANYHPRTWFAATALLGTDIDNIGMVSQLAGGQVSPTDGGYVQNDRRAFVNRSMGLNATTTVHPSVFSFRTSLGTQYTYHQLDGTSTRGSGLPPGSVNLNLARSKNANATWDESIDLGGYGEEVVGVRDRLFVTGSLRVDGATSFGEAYHPTPFPKFGLSWIASEEPWLHNAPGLQELRFRYSYGSASRHPTAAMKAGQINAGTLRLNNQSTIAYVQQDLANPILKPERSNEHEWGADATILNGTTVQLTWYHQKVIDQLAQQELQGIGYTYYWANSATLTKHGFEAVVNVPVVSARHVQGEVAFAYDYNTSKVLSVPSGQTTRPTVVGYPIDAVFGRPAIAVLDTAGGGPDSVVIRSEIVRPDQQVYLGVLQPPRTFSITPSFRLFNGIVGISSLIDYAGGYLSTDALSGCRADCLALFSKNTPLIVQAHYINGYPEDFMTKTTYTRWRELTIRASIPQAFLRRLNVVGFQLISGASVALQGRNLALWSSYKATDPESHSERDPAFSPTVAGIPQPRSWALRFDITP